MSMIDYRGIAAVAGFLIIMTAYTIYLRKRQAPALRAIGAYQRLQRAIGLVVEAGNRLHIALGSGNLISPQSGIEFLGLSVLGWIARTTSLGDRPPVSTAGEGALNILAQNTQRGAMRELGGYFDPSLGRITGMSPFAYAAGASLLINEEKVGASLMLGTFSSEASLIIEATERAGGESLGGTDDIAGMAVMFTSTQEPLIGEEAFAAGAYLGAGNFHFASLFAQDVLRWVLIVIILIGAILKLSGIL